MKFKINLVFVSATVFLVLFFAFFMSSGFGLVSDLSNPLSRFAISGFAVEGTYISNFSLAPNAGNWEGLYFNGTYFWAVDNAGLGVYLYYANGTYTGTNWTTTGQISQPTGITSDGNYFYVSGFTGSPIKRYTLSGSFVDSFITSSGGLTDVYTNGSYIWALSYADTSIYKYYMNGTNTGISINLSLESSGVNVNPTGLTSNGTYFWVADSTDSEVYKYYVNGTYIGSHFDTAVSGNTNVEAITNNGTYFWTIDYNDYIYRYDMDVSSGSDTTSPTITFQSPTPANGSTVTDSTQTITANISETSSNGLSSVLDFDNSLLVYYSFDSYNSTGIFDNSSYHNFGLFQGTSLGVNNISLMQRGNGLAFYNDFSGTQQNYIKGANISLGTNWTYAFWLYHDHTLYQAYDSPISIGSNEIYVYKDSPFNLSYNDGTTDFRSNYAVPNLEWFHAVFSYDGTTLRLYINGSLYQSWTNSINIPSGVLNVGAWDNGAGDFLNGNMDEVEIYNRSISADEVKALYDSQANLLNSTFSALSLGQHNYTVYAIDKEGNTTNKVQNFIYSLTGSDTTPPTYSNANVNSTEISQTTSFNLTVDDNSNLNDLGYYIFSTNNSGVWINDSAVNFATTPQSVYVAKTLNDTSGISVGYIWYLYDNASNKNDTGILTLTTTDPSVIYVDSCQALSTSNKIYTLNTSLSGISGYCFNITSNNVTFDLGGYQINATPGGSGFDGILIRGSLGQSLSNITVRNGEVNYFANGIEAYSNYSNFYDLTFRNGYYTSSIDATGILFNYQNSFYKQWNNFSDLRFENISGEGIFAERISNSTFDKIYGVGNNYSTFNIIRGINLTFSNSIFENDTDDALGLENVNNSIFSNITTSTFFDDFLDGNVWINLSNNNLFYNINITTNQSIAVGVYNNSLNNTFISSDYNNSKEIVGVGGELIRKWYFDTNVEYQNGTAIEGANVTIYNSSSVGVYSGLTNATGGITQQILSEYKNSGGTKTYASPYTVTVTKSGFADNSTNYNLTVLNDASVISILSLPDTTSPTISFESPTPSNGSTVISSTQIITANISDNSNLNTSSFIDFDRSLVGYWSFDFNSSVGIYDNSSYGNFATFNGTNFGISNISTGARGNGINLDGNNDFIEVPQSSSLNISGNAITLSVWVKFKDTTSNSAETIISKPVSASVHSAPYFSYNIQRTTSSGTANDYPRIWISTSNDTSGAFTSYSGDVINENTWYNVVGTYNGSEICTYLNGNLLGSCAAASGNLLTYETPLRLGLNGGFTEGLNGSIDEVMVFNRTLSSDEILALYDSRANKFNASFSNLALGQHNYTVYAIDTSGNINTSTQNFIISSSVSPTITFVSPTYSDGAKITTNYTYINATVSSDTDTSAFFDFNNSLIAYYGMDYYNSTGIYDNSSYGNFALFNGTLGTSDIVSGKRGNALNFDRTTNSYLNAGEILPTNSYTESAWIYMAQQTASNEYNILSGDTTSGGHAFWVPNSLSSSFCSNTGGTAWAVRAGHNNDWCEVVSTSAVPLNTWTHVSVTYDSTTTTMKLYFNGVLEDTNTSVDAVSDPTVQIGGFIGNNLWNGSLDEVTLFNRALSDSEIQALYNSSQYGLKNNFTNLVENTTYNYTVYSVDADGDFSSSTRNITYLEPSFIAFGDSITWGYNVSDTGNPILDSWGNVTAQNLSLPFVKVAQSGAQVSVEMQNHISNISGYSPNSTLVFMGGTNDINAGESQTHFENNYTILVQTALGYGYSNDSIYLTSVPWSNATGYVGNIETYSNYVKNVADAENVNFINLSSFLTNHNEYLQSDGIHPNNAGHNEIANVVSYYILNGVLPTVSDTTPPTWTTIPSDDSITYPTIWNGEDFDATDDVAIDAYFTNDSRFTINSTGYLNSTGILGVGIYSINVSVNDTSNNINSTVYSLTVNQNTTNLSLTGTTPITYGTSGDIQGINCPSQLTCNLYRNGTSVSNPDTSILTAGTYHYIYNTSGNENYTSDTVDFNLTINKNISVVHTYLNNLRANVSINTGNSIWLNGTLQVGAGGIKLYNNDTLINQGTSPIENLTIFSSSGLYNITTISDGNENYTSSSETWWVNATTSPDTTEPIFTTIPANATIIYGNETLGVDFDATDDFAISTYFVNDSEFSINSTGWLSNNSILAVGNYSVNISVNDTSNNVNSTVYNIVINLNPSSCAVYYNETSPINYPSTFSVWSDCNSAFTLKRNGTTISNNSGQSLSVGTYNFSVERTDNSNYSNIFNWSLFTINSESSSGSFGSSSGSSSSGSSTGSGLTYTVNTSTINADVGIGTTIVKIISITNTGTSDLNLTIGQNNLNKMIILPSDYVELAPGEKKDLEFIFVGLNNTGTFSGTISIGSRVIPVSLNVKELNLLFDSNIYVLNKDYIIRQGEQLKTSVELIPKGDPARLDVTLNYAIKDYSGNVYLTRSESVLVQDTTKFDRNFDTGILPEGKYLISLELVYPNGVAPSSAYFEVIPFVPTSTFGKVVFYLINTILIVLVLIIGLVIKNLFPFIRGRKSSVLGKE